MPRRRTSGPAIAAATGVSSSPRPSGVEATPAPAPAAAARRAEPAAPRSRRPAAARRSRTLLLAVAAAVVGAAIGAGAVAVAAAATTAAPRWPRPRWTRWRTPTPRVRPGWCERGRRHAGARGRPAGPGSRRRLLRGLAADAGRVGPGPGRHHPGRDGGLRDPRPGSTSTSTRSSTSRWSPSTATRRTRATRWPAGCWTAEPPGGSPSVSAVSALPHEELGAHLALRPPPPRGPAPGQRRRAAGRAPARWRPPPTTPATRPSWAGTSPRPPPTTCCSRAARCSAGWSAWPPPTSPSSSRRRPRSSRCSPAGGCPPDRGWPACPASTRRTSPSCAPTGCAPNRCRSTAIGRADVDAIGAAAARRPAPLRAPHAHRQPSRPAPARRRGGRAVPGGRRPPGASTPRSRWATSTPTSAADVVYGTSRKWLAGPRGVGVLCARPAIAAQLTPGAARAGRGAAAARVRVRRGARRRPGRAWSWRSATTWPRGPTGCASGWRRWAGPRGRCSTASPAGGPSSPTDEPTATTTLRPPDGVDVVATRARLLGRARHRHQRDRPGARARRDDRPGAARLPAPRRRRRRPRGPRRRPLTGRRLSALRRTRVPGAGRRTPPGWPRRGRASRSPGPTPT